MPVSHKKPERKIFYNVTELPTYLYQYKSLVGERMSWAKEFITTNEFYFSSAKYFNDPLDCKIEPIFDTSIEIKKAYWKKVFNRDFPNLKKQDFNKVIKKFLKEDKTSAGRYRFKQQFFKSLNKHGILCLTERPNNMLMWAYYANGHKGICYRFKLIPRNLENIPPKSLLFLKMDYDNNFPKTNFYKDSIEDFIRDIFGTKAKCWEHEKEWRFITISKAGKVQCPILKLDAIIFGLKTDRKEYKESIRDWIGNKEETIELLQVKNKRRSFELEIIPEGKS